MWHQAYSETRDRNKAKSKQADPKDRNDYCEMQKKNVTKQEVVIISMRIFAWMGTLLIHGHTHSINSLGSNFPINSRSHATTYGVDFFLLVSRLRNSHMRHSGISQCLMDWQYSHIFSNVTINLFNKTCERNYYEILSHSFAQLRQFWEFAIFFMA